jgi:hypothetical protein
MDSPLKVQFDDPQGGWMAITIQSSAGVVTLSASSVLYDTLDELVDGLHALATGDHYRSVRIFEEPTSCELRFKRENSAMGLELCRFPSFSPARSAKSGETLFEAVGTFVEICFPFWRALRNLQTRFPDDEFRLRWHRSFPDAGMQKLSANLHRLRW